MLVSYRLSARETGMNYGWRYFVMGRVYNFSAGPSCLPESVLRKAADEMLDYEGSGQSVMEMSHRQGVGGAAA